MKRRKRKNPVGIVLPILGAAAAAVLAIVLTRKSEPERELQPRGGVLARAESPLTPPLGWTPPATATNIDPMTGKRTGVFDPMAVHQFAAFSVRAQTDPTPFIALIDPLTGQY